MLIIAPVSLIWAKTKATGVEHTNFIRRLSVTGIAIFAQCLAFVSNGFHSMLVTVAIRAAIPCVNDGLCGPKESPDPTRTLSWKLQENTATNKLRTLPQNQTRPTNATNSEEFWLHHMWPAPEKQINWSSNRTDQVADIRKIFFFQTDPLAPEDIFSQWINVSWTYKKCITRRELILAEAAPRLHTGLLTNRYCTPDAISCSVRWRWARYAKECGFSPWLFFQFPVFRVL